MSAIVGVGLEWNTLRKRQALALATTAYEHCAFGLQGLKHGLTKFSTGSSQLAVEILVTTLVFCFIEVIRGDENGSAFYHLNAARHILSSIANGMYTTAAADAKILAFIAEFYAYILSSSSVGIRNVVPQEILDSIEKNVRPFIETDKLREGAFFPSETRRVFGLAGKSPTFFKNIVANPLYQAVCDKMLTAEYKSWLRQKLETLISRPQLKNTIVFSISPDARRQELHSDDMIHHNPLTAITADQYKTGRDTDIGWFVAGKKATKANCATRFVPGSDGLMMLSSCFHEGGSSTTTDEEGLVYSCFMTKGYLRQEENQYLAPPLEKIRQYYNADLQKLIGYQVSNPCLGWLDLGDPRKALYGKDWAAKVGGLH
ncbi:hypothetical protein QBC36DRAFT_303672 [Triangularia setosa]|uniref:Uncharacterized protein n=1 Tax=Triangularia setosa TaxID=2587417 RepID=A0AAN6W198_9PEZI|nr:hypothetical protein QBC36DRAFT_303672 [Podospora setosa]